VPYRIGGTVIRLIFELEEGATPKGKAAETKRCECIKTTKRSREPAESIAILNQTCKYE